MYRVLCRRSFGLVALPAFLAVIALHVLLRSRSWTHEWFWAEYELNFVTILLGPIAGGVAAWEAARRSRFRVLHETSDRPVFALLWGWLAYSTWVIGAFVAGMLGVIAMVKAAGTPGWPSARDVASAVPALALLAVECALGYALGWVTRSTLTAPATAVGIFLLSLLLYIRGPDQFIIVGGATDSLVGLQLRAALGTAQAAFYLLAAIGAVVVAAQVVRPRLARRPTLSVVAVIPAVAAALLLGHTGDRRFDRVAASVTCWGTAPQVCAAPGYRPRLPAVRDALLPFVNALTAAGVRAPQRFSQGVTPGGGDVGPLDLMLLTLTDPGERSVHAAQVVLVSYVPKTCRLDASPALMQDFEGVGYWLVSRVRPAEPPPPDLPRVFVRGTPEEQAAWVRRATAEMLACRAGG